MGSIEFLKKMIEEENFDSQRLTIVIADDDDTAVELMMLSINNLRLTNVNFEVVRCKTSAEAIRYITENEKKIGLVITELTTGDDCIGEPVVNHIRQKLKNEVVSIMSRSSRSSFHNDDLDMMQRFEIDGYIPKQYTRIPDMTLMMTSCINKYFRLKQYIDSVKCKGVKLCRGMLTLDVLLKGCEFCDDVIFLKGRLKGEGVRLKENIKEVLGKGEEE